MAFAGGYQYRDETCFRTLVDVDRIALLSPSFSSSSFAAPSTAADLAFSRPLLALFFAAGTFWWPFLSRLSRKKFAQNAKMLNETDQIRSDSASTMQRQLQFAIYYKSCSRIH